MSWLHFMVDDMAIIEVYVIFCREISCWDISCMFTWWIIRRRDVYFLFIYYNCV